VSDAIRRPCSDFMGMLRRLVNYRIIIIINIIITRVQVKANSDGHWIKAEPVPNSVLVMIGELLQRWTANRLPATVSSR